MGQVQNGGALVRRPATGTTPAVRVSRLAQLERRAARARRRLVLTLLLVLATAAGWAVVGLGFAPWYAGAVPSALLVLVLVFGRIAVVSARRSDARWAAEVRSARRQATQARALANGGPYAPRNRARVTGHAVQPSATRTQMIPRVSADDIRRAVEAEKASRRDVIEPEPVPEDAVMIIEEPSGSAAEPPTGVGGTAWDPVPVPLPTYVTKPPAPRREPRPLTGSTSVVAPSTATSASSHVSDSDVPRDELLVADPPRPVTETLGLPLEQILARRRAAG